MTVWKQEPSDAGQGIAAGNFNFAHVAHVEDGGPCADRKMLVDDAGVASG